MKVLVTGASGLIGAAIVEKLSEFNYEIYALLNSESKEQNSAIGKTVHKVFYADIGDAASVGKISDIGEIDAVIHCAGLAHQFGNTAESDFRRINVRGTANIAELAVSAKANHFVLISSVAVYGKISEISNNAEARGVSEDADCRPEDFYSRSKLDSEKSAQAICVENNINLTILRLATVIGEEDRGNVARLIKTIDDNRFFWIGSGENLKSLIYKEDVAEACRLVLEKKSSGVSGKSEALEIFNVTAEALPMNDIVSEIYQHLQKKNPGFRLSPKILNPFFVLNRKTFRIGKIEKLHGTIVKWLADDVFSNRKIKEQYGFEPKTPVSEAIRREVENYRKAK